MSQLAFENPIFTVRQKKKQNFLAERAAAGLLALRAFNTIFRTTPAMWIQVVLFAVTNVIGFLRGFHELDYVLLIMVYGVSLGFEAKNTTTELIADQLMVIKYRLNDPHSPLTDEQIITTRGHARIKEIKDSSAGSVTPIFYVGLAVSIFLLVRPF